MTWLFWLTHCTGSVCRVSLSSTAMPPDEDHDAHDREQHGGARRDAPEAHDEPSEGPARVVAAPGRALELADAEDREREHDRADADDGDADREQQAEVADHRHLREPQRGEREDRVERDDEQRGAEVAGRLLDRVRRAVDDDLLLDVRVHLDRVVDADPEHHGQPGDRHDGEGDPDVAGESERPHDADEHDGKWEEAPPDREQREQDADHDRHRDPAQRQHPAAEVVVEVLESTAAPVVTVCGPGSFSFFASRCTSSDAEPSLLDRRVPRQPGDDLRVRLVEDDRAQRLPDLALVVVEEELHVRRVVEGALRSRDGERAAAASPPCRSRAAAAGRTRCLLCLRLRGAPWPAMLVAGFPSGLETSASSNCRIVSGVTTFFTWPLRQQRRRGSASTAPRPSAVNRSSTVWPGSIAITVSIA